MTGINCLLRHVILIGGFFKLNDSFLPFCSPSPVLSHQNKIQKDKEKSSELQMSTVPTTIN